jgi:hypothetical protein
VTESTQAAAPGDGTPVTFGPGDYQLVDPAVGIANLSGFRATLTASFDGTREGVPESWVQTEVAEVSRDPQIAAFNGERTGTGAFTLLNLTMGGVQYVRDAAGRCIARAATTATDAAPDDFALRGHPVELLPALIGGVEVGPETVGSLDTMHYRFDESALGLASPVTATGDVWVAQAEGHVVRYSLIIDGATPYLGLSVSGRYTLEYELQLSNELPEATVPADCPAGAVDVALPDGATEIIASPGMQTYSTELTEEELQPWYDSQLVAAGWTEVTAPLISAGAALLTYERQGERLVVSMSPGANATAVIVLLTRSV